MTLAVRGRLLVDGELVPGVAIVEGGQIARVLRRPRRAELPERVLEAEIVAPGFVDLQLNGAFGVDVATGGAEALRILRRRLPETGVTAFVATLLSSTDEVIVRVAADVETVATEEGGARLLGLHLEGPLLSPRRAGVHPRAVIEAARAVASPARIVTLAPERPGALDVIRELGARGVVVSLGHTDATHEELVAGADAGATMVTHLFNAMSPFSHRAPGAVGAALVDDRLTVGLIADGVHVHPAALRLAVRAKGVERVALVTDAIAAAGMPAGEHTLAGLRVLADDVTARLPDGTLAGSVLTMDAAVRNMVTLAGVSPADALRMASEIPARLLGRDARLTRGSAADLVLLDASLHVVATLVAGAVM